MAKNRRNRSRKRARNRKPREKFRFVSDILALLKNNGFIRIKLYRAKHKISPL